MIIEKIEQIKREIARKAHLMGMVFDRNEIVVTSHENSIFIMLRSIKKGVISTDENGQEIWKLIDEPIIWIEWISPTFNPDPENRETYIIEYYPPKVVMLYPELVYQIKLDGLLNN